MMAATLSGTVSSTPDTPSPVYPDRLIRPLPKRPLRSRLSPEAAGSILYPPTPPVSQLFYSPPYPGLGERNDGKTFVEQNPDQYGHDSTPNRDRRPLYENGYVVESGDEDGPVVVRRSTGFRGSTLSPLSPSSSNINGHQSHAVVGQPTTQTKPTPTGLDGYDAFENTNNKKKRKIPTSGSLSSHHSSLTAELANMELSGSPDPPVIMPNDNNGTGTHYVQGGSATAPMGSGFSGSGRGRLGRSSLRNGNARNSLSVHSHNSWLSRSGAGRREFATLPQSATTGELGEKSDQGIISAAIANAAALSTSKGQENVSLLDQHASKTTPTRTQFTFTCESDSSKGMALQANNSYPMPLHPRQPPTSLPVSANHRDLATQGTQTSPNVATQAKQQLQSRSNTSTAGTQGSAPEKKPRRSPSSLYALAARQRKMQQQYSNLHNPPSPEDIWICEFCEYEAIFGHPPEALIRQYEIKDRKERRRLAEKRRLLEKAKMKGRKGKKVTKNAAKQTTGSHSGSHQSYDRQPMDSHPESPHGPEYTGEYGDSVLIPEPPQQPPAQTFNPPVFARGGSTNTPLEQKNLGGGDGGGAHPAL